jgi:hypothetical protein
VREETFAVTANGFVIARNDLPDRLVSWWANGRLTIEQLPEALTDAWTSAEWPGRMLHKRDWLEMFHCAGFISDTGRTKSTEPMELFRAQVGRIYGMSWTEDRELAEWFHIRNARTFDRDAVVLRGIVEPDGILAIFEDQRAGMPIGLEHLPHGPAETEVVIDPAYLRRPVSRITSG